MPRSVRSSVARCVDRFGRKAIYTYDLVVYMAWCVACGLRGELPDAAQAFVITWGWLGAGARVGTYIAGAGAVIDRPGQAYRHRSAGLVRRAADLDSRLAAGLAPWG